ncbi:MAG: hypothetical protein QM696_11280 [Steroidobacteraceae bacterium]
MSSSSAERTATTSSAPDSLFVINLCASTTPMALVHPSNPELKRYTFFVTRQREEGRERFRLHMGYFASLFEAETLLGAVRDVYPAAWAGPAPTQGAPRRGRAATAAAASPAAEAAAPAPMAAAPEPAQQPAPELSLEPEPASAPEPAAASVSTPESAPAPAPVSVPTAVPAPAAVPTLAPASTSTSTIDAMSNLRDVLAQLGDDAPTRLMPAPASIPTLSESQTLRILEPAAAAAKAPVAQVSPPVAAKPAARPVPAAKVAPPKPKPAAPAKIAPPPDEQDQVRLVTPEDTQTLRDIRLDVERNAPPCFAVQLLWSVTPITITDHPHLAIFDAYTLYNVEGNRQGRKWYGLRLGFFTDPNAATQVAYYVRSDYPAVAVVPVAEKERDRARGGEPAPAAPRAAAPAEHKLPDGAPLQHENLDGFELLEDDRPPPVKRDVEDAPAAVQAAQAAAKVPAKAPVKPAAKTAAKPVRAPAKPTGKRVVVRKGSSRVPPGAATPLDQTLEILGASTLTLDESREIINDSAIRTPVSTTKTKKGGRLAKLLNRLGGS